MTSNVAQTIQPHHVRQRQHVLGKGLQLLYAGLAAEPPHTEFLQLLEQADQRQSLIKSAA